MANEFQFDVFLSHSAKDKAVVRDVAARLQQALSGAGADHHPAARWKFSPTCCCF
jgi:hypothetical protein